MTLMQSNAFKTLEENTNVYYKSIHQNVGSMLHAALSLSCPFPALINIYDTLLCSSVYIST